MKDFLNRKSHVMCMIAGLQHLPRKGHSHVAAGRRPADLFIKEPRCRETVTATPFGRPPFHGFVVRDVRPPDRGLESYEVRCSHSARMLESDHRERQFVSERKLEMGCGPLPT